MKYCDLSLFWKRFILILVLTALGLGVLTIIYVLLTIGSLLHVMVG